jgi:hypothetical protein
MTPPSEVSELLAQRCGAKNGWRSLAISLSSKIFYFA